MAQITLKGSPVSTVGELPAVGSSAPTFTLTTSGLEDVTLDSYKGKWKVLSIVPSLDTGVCATSAKTFNGKAAALENTVILSISADLPFAQSRFCETEGVDKVVGLSTFRSPGFGTDYGVAIQDGALAGVMSRAVVVIDPDDTVVYTEQVAEITQEPDYDSALNALG